MNTEQSAILPVSGKSALVLGGVLTAIASGTIAVMLPGIAAAFGEGSDSVVVKMVSTATGLGMMIGAPVGGHLADRLGRRRVLIWATIVFGLLGVGLMAASALWQLVVARFIIGLATGSMSVIYIALIGDYFTGKLQSRWLGYNGAAATFFVVILNPIVGALTDVGWQYGFLVYAAAWPILLLVVLGVPSDAPRDEASEWIPLAFRKLPWPALAIAIVAGTLATGTSLYWPFRLSEVGVDSARDIALYALPNVFLIGASAFAYGRLRTKLTITQTFVLCGALSTVGLVIMAIGETPMVVALGLIFEGVAIGFLTPNLSMYTISVSPPEIRGRTIGVVKGAYFGSPFVTQFVLEWINKATNISGALIAIAVMASGLGIVMFFRALSETKRPATS